MKLRRQDASPSERDRRRRHSVQAAFRRHRDGRPAAPPPDDDEDSPPPSLRWGEPGADGATLGIGGAVVPPQNRALAAEPSEPPAALSANQDISEYIRSLEARLDGMLLDAGDAIRAPAAPPPPPPPVPAPSGPDDNLADDPPPAAEEPDPVRRSPFYRRMWGSAGHRQRAEHVDEFGLDPDFESRFARPLVDFLYRHYFRVQADGIEHVPASGRCLVVANHSGTLPLDGPILRAALRRDHPAHREMRWLAEDFLYYLPFAGTTITRVGAVRACNENAERLLRGEQCVAVFPEGVRGISKLYRDRYRLQRFGRGGFVRLALRSGAPIVPCAIVGAEETGPLLFREEMLSKWFGLPYLPVTATFPWLGPAGLLPAPTRWKLWFGEPIEFASYGPGAAEDDVLVGRLADHVRSQIQQMLDDGVRARRSVWFG